MYWSKIYRRQFYDICYLFQTFNQLGPKWSGRSAAPAAEVADRDDQLGGWDWMLIEMALDQLDSFYVSDLSKLHSHYAGDRCNKFINQVHLITITLIVDYGKSCNQYDVFLILFISFTAVHLLLPGSRPLLAAYLQIQCTRQRLNLLGNNSAKRFVRRQHSY